MIWQIMYSVISQKREEREREKMKEGYEKSAEAPQ